MGATLINDTFIVTLCEATLNGTENSLQDCMINNVSSCPCDETTRLQCQPGNAWGINIIDFTVMYTFVL